MFLLAATALKSCLLVADLVCCLLLLLLLLTSVTCAKQRCQRLSSWDKLCHVEHTQLATPRVTGSRRVNMCCKTSKGSSPSTVSSPSASSSAISVHKEQCQGIDPL